MQNWSDSKTWNERWIGERALNSGGQATAKLVKNKDSKTIAFAKILSRQGDMERRARFFREATSYATTKHKLIPNLLESNAQHYEDSEYKIYLVTDFIKGLSLSEYVRVNGPMSFDEASTVLMGLIDVVGYLHANDWVHRDIKPDNIILKDSNLETPVLLDFGIGYNAGVNGGFETDYAQELGNRFLRLPEMSSGSTAKHDKRTDISFLGGILYYLITATVPCVLIDEEGRMPHQRAGIVEALRLGFQWKLPLLLDFFDKSFSQKLSGRFSSTQDMGALLQRLIDMHRTPRENEEDSLSLNDILSSLNTKVNQDLVRNKALYDLAMSKITSVHSRILQQIKPTYVSYQTSYVNFVDGLRNDLGFTHFATHDQRFVPSFLIQVLGDELVILADGLPIYRTDVDSPVFSEALENAVEKIYLGGLKKLVEASPR
jgi:serine/threonine protein kinase